MTSAPINEMTAMLSGTINSSASPKASDMGKDSFGDILGNLSSNNSDVTESYSKVQASVKDEVSEGITKAEKIDAKDEPKDNIKSETVKADSKTETADNSKDISEEDATSLKDEIITNTAKELDITEEELENILETLGLTAFDLLDPDNVAKLVTEVKADGDMLSLVTNEDIRTLVMDINEGIQTSVEELSNELGIPKDDIIAKLEDAINTKDEPVIESFSNDNVINNESSIPVITASTETNPLQKSDDVLSADNTNDVVSLDGTVVTNTLETAKDNSTADDSATFEKKDDNESNDKGLIKNDNAFAQQAFNVNTEPEVINAPNISEDTLGHLNTEQSEIINQVNEMIKANIKPDLTSVEMQLNPEHLGNVNVQIASSEGSVTAKFVTDNETVRAALESQIITLRENLENQGVKVNAVDVTVASHEFERNLDNKEGGQQAKEEEERKLRKATRKLNLDDILADEYYEGLDEEQIVTADMMKADGNQMDYKV